MSNRRIYPGRQWKDRLAMWAEEFPRHYMVPAEELKITGFFTKERLSMNQALEEQDRKQSLFLPELPGETTGSTDGFLRK